MTHGAYFLFSLKSFVHARTVIDLCFLLLCLLIIITCYDFEYIKTCLYFLFTMYMYSSFCNHLKGMVFSPFICVHDMYRYGLCHVSKLS